MLDPEYLRQLVTHYGYLALFLGAAAEGFHVMLLAGFLSATHYIYPLPAFIAVSSGCFLADSAIYCAGYFGGSRTLEWLKNRFRKFGRSLEMAHKYMHKYPARVFFIVKITTGFAIATILSAGASRMKPAKFLGWDFLANLLVAALMMSLGYFFGHGYLLVYQAFHYWALILIAAIVVLFVAFNRYSAAAFDGDQTTS